MSPGRTRLDSGNHDLGDGLGELPLDTQLLGAHRAVFGADRLAVEAGAWKLLGIKAQLLDTDSPEDELLWEWIDSQVGPATRHATRLCFCFARCCARNRASWAARAATSAARRRSACSRGRSIRHCGWSCLDTPISTSTSLRKACGT